LPIRIKNLTLRPVIVPLNSGTNLRLSPGEASGDVQEVELKENPKVDKLLSRRVIAVLPRTEETATQADAGEGAPEAASPEGTDVSARPRRRS
jgi:hypothetical protein